ncbi:hypothetical protein [Amycolatopsis sp. NPDC051128]|uniref:hypothetical protein n=1 Tax=Amycolatopsis sp. NPDC051128 TaxID=3155412 RepID=UPI00341BB775
MTNIAGQATCAMSVRIGHGTEGPFGGEAAIGHQLADLFGADTAVGTRLATAGQFIEQLGNDILRAVEKRARAIPAAGTKRARASA